MSTLVAESVQRRVLDAKPRNLFSCDKCRNDKKSCHFSSPWDEDQRSPPCNRCQKKGRTCAGPVYISRKLKNATNTIAVVEEHLVEENELLEEQAQVQAVNMQDNGMSHSTTNVIRQHAGPRPMQAWGLTAVVSSEDDDIPDPKEVLIQLINLNATRELLRSCFYVLDDVRQWCPGCSTIPKAQHYLELIRTVVDTQFTKLADQAYADTKMKTHYHSDLLLILSRFQNPPTRPARPRLNDNAGREFESLFDRINNDQLDRQRKLGVYSAADHLCHNVCNTMSSGRMPRLGFDLPHLLLNAFQAIDKVLKGIQIPREDNVMIRPSVINAGPSTSTTSSVGSFPLSHFTLLQADNEILRRYARKDLRCLSEVDLLGRTIFHVAAYFGRTSFLESVLDDHCEKQIMSTVKQDVFKLYPVMIAACRNDVEAVKLFVKHGANLNAVDGNNQTALDLAVQKGATDVVTWLLEHDHGTCSYGNPLLQAVMSAQFGVLQAFISHYATRDHHRYDDVIEAAKFADDMSWDDMSWHAIATALLELESNRPSCPSMGLGNMTFLGFQDVHNMPTVDPVPSQAMAYPFPNVQINEGTPIPYYCDPFTPHLHGPIDPSQQPDQG